MPSVINEHTQYLDSAGLPIVSGKVYIGTRNLDPKTNTITIYSDRDLTTTISNPQTLDANGRTTNKIWVPGRYSIQVDNSADVQQYQELDAGEESQTGITTLTNVAGTNTVTAEGTPTAVTTLTNNQQYNFIAANANTGAVTLQIDLTAAKSIKKQHDVDLTTGDIQQDQVVAVVYNSTDDVFELVSNIAAAEYTTLSTNEIKFPATQVPSADVNTLDDYEEGTWTPHLNGTETLSFAEGEYVKIGRLVFVSWRLGITTIGTGSTNNIYGLPFPVKVVNPICGASIYSWSGLSPTDIYNLIGGASPSTDTIVFNTQTTSGGSPSTIAIFQNGSSILGSCVYISTA